MFESRQQLAGEIEGVLEAIRVRSGGLYACLLEPTRILFESAEPAWQQAGQLRGLVERHGPALFQIPAAMASGAPIEDVFEGWRDDEFLLAVINGRVALLVCCPQAEAFRERSMPLVQALADRLFRLEPRYRIDLEGRGLFLGRPKLELVVVGSQR